MTNMTVKKSSKPRGAQSAAKKSLGQHFLLHQRTADRIADAAKLGTNDTVLEIGPGTGMLTRSLLARAGKVVAVEADRELFVRLQATFAEEIAAGQLELVSSDIRTFDLTLLPRGYRVVANIPYYLTGDIIRRLLEAERQPAELTLLIQKEVAERITRAKKESILSLSVKAYGTPTYAFTVPRGAFIPAPSVDSAVLVVQNVSREHFHSREEEALFFRLVRAGFAHRRKYLANNLAEAGYLSGSIVVKARAEDLSLADWFALMRAQAVSK